MTIAISLPVDIETHTVPLFKERKVMLNRTFQDKSMVAYLQPFTAGKDRSFTT